VARSLHVKHEEQPATSSLLNIFLLIAFGWLAMGALVAATASEDDSATITLGE
jgi:hypothetical protein